MYMPMGYAGDPALDYAAVTEGVALWDVGAERQVELSGPDARSFADLLTTRDLSDLAPGRCRYALVCDERGAVICDPVVLHVEANRVWLSHGNVDLLLWAVGVARGAGLDVHVAEADVAPVQLQSNALMVGAVNFIETGAPLAGREFGVRRYRRPVADQRDGLPRSWDPIAVDHQARVALADEGGAHRLGEVRAQARHADIPGDMAV